MSVRGVPTQELPENQAPEVAYNLIEVTGERLPIAIPVAGVLDSTLEEDKPKRRGRPPKVKPEESASDELEE